MTVKCNREKIAVWSRPWVVTGWATDGEGKGQNLATKRRQVLNQDTYESDCESEEALPVFRALDLEDGQRGQKARVCVCVSVCVCREG